MAYTLTGHPLLSDDAQNLSPEQQASQQLVAEVVLGLRGTSYTGSDQEEAEAALALQVSLQVAVDPEAYLASSVTRGSRSITYRNQIPVHPLAKEIADGLGGNSPTMMPRLSAAVDTGFTW